MSSGTETSPGLAQAIDRPPPPPPVDRGSTLLIRVTAWLLLLIGLAFLCVLLARYLGYVATLLAYPHEWDEDEGLAIYFARQLSLHRPMYVDVNHLPMLTACYPPVYHLMLWPLVKLLGPTLLAGRLLSLAATFVFCSFTALLIRLESASWRLGTLGVGLVLGSPVISIWSPLARIDSLAIALALAGIFLLHRSRSTGFRTFAGAFLLLLATYTRYQTVFLVPAALYILWRRSRREALVGVLTFGAGALVLLLALTLWSNGHFWTSTVTLQTCGFDTGLLVERVQRFATRHLILLVGMFFWTVESFMRRNIDLWAALSLTVIPMEMLLGKVGASINYNMPVVVIAAICTTLAAQRMLARTGGQWIGKAGCVVFALLIVQALLYWNEAVPSPNRVDRETNDAIVQQIKSTPGEVLTQRRLMLSLMAGREPQIDICTLHFAYQIGRDTPYALYMDRPTGPACWDPAELTQAVQQRRYQLILLDEPSLFPPTVNRTIHRTYRNLEAVPRSPRNWHGSNRYHLAVPLPQGFSRPAE